MTSAVLTLNAGSSSIKFALFETGTPPRRIASGEIESIGAAPHIRARDSSGVILEQNWPGQTHEDFLSRLLDWAGGASWR